jgi:hypothetical protein
MGSPKMVVAVAVAILSVAACGGSGAASNGAASASVPSGAVTTTVAPTATTGAPTTASSDAASTTASPAGGAVDLCGLLSAADLKTATGGDYGEGKLDDYGQCTWLVGDAGVNTGDGQVVAAIQEVPLDTFKNTFSGGVDVTVNGHAGYWNPTQGIQSIWVDVGGRTLVMSFDPVSADGQAIAQKLAEIAIANM